MNKTLKRYLISSAETFATGFAIVLIPQMETITLESFRDGSVVGILFVSTRMGIKMLLEVFISWRSR